MQVVTILGSNSGNKRQLITEAIRILSSTEQWVMASSFYETALYVPILLEAIS